MSHRCVATQLLRPVSTQQTGGLWAEGACVWGYMPVPHARACVWLSGSWSDHTQLESLRGFQEVIVPHACACIADVVRGAGEMSLKQVQASKCMRACLHW